MCKTLLPDVVVPEAHHIDCSMYVSSADLLSVHYARILHGGWLHGGPQKTTKLSKLVSGYLRGDGRLPGTVWYVYIYLLYMFRAI